MESADVGAGGGWGTVTLKVGCLENILETAHCVDGILSTDQTILQLGSTCY